MEMITNIRRWRNKKRIDQVNINIEHLSDLVTNVFGKAYVFDGLGLPIGRILVSYSSEPSKGAIAQSLIAGKSYLTIDDIVIYKKEWRGIHVGTNLFRTSILRLKQDLPDDTIVDGLITDLDVIGFWQNFGFKFVNTDEGCGFIACKLSEIRLGKNNE
ncbi:MAG: hypothetical protein Q8L70_00765 [Methylotenera sp.]|nr:hypothetical protein [Methylotenera sp.]MDP1958611.1 hypothetical protein [Methylotenera sp.]MDP3943767.1 hypothetical protein [Methylotenera sp.]